MLNRRQILSSLGLTTATSLLTGCSEIANGSPKQESVDASSAAALCKADIWRYAALDPAEAAAEAYRRYSDGGCMYGVTCGVLTALAKKQGLAQSPFPLHMMRYGAGGVGHWGSLCGTLNGGAAMFGLFEHDKKQYESLITELFSWYEQTALPVYAPKDKKDDSPFVTTVSASVLCHLSIGKWSAKSGAEVGSPEVKERCRRLTADVAAKTVELLNANLQKSCKFAGLTSEAKTCNSCHGKEIKDTVAKMRCDGCHQQLSKKHPTLPAVSAHLPTKTK
jgi:hypothetical protein